MRPSRRAFLLSGTATLLCGQTKTARVRVTDETGARIAGAEVTFMNGAGEHIETLHTDNRGEALYSGSEFRNLQVTSPGMKRYLLMDAGNASSLDVKLGVSREIIEWSGAPPAAVGRLRMQVTDGNGRSLATAHGWMPTGDERTVLADPSGVILFAGITLGQVSFVIAADGFPTRVVTATLGSADEITLSVSLAS